MTCQECGCPVPAAQWLTDCGHCRDMLELTGIDLYVAWIGQVARMLAHKHPDAQESRRIVLNDLVNVNGHDLWKALGMTGRYTRHKLYNVIETRFNTAERVNL